ncbi:MAG: HEPN domain-containing protein [Chloroflexota bacterium]
MKHRDPTNPRAWLARARGNLTLAEKGGRLKGILFEDLCFNAQQAAEKALKAVCLAQGLDFPKTHSLVHLMDLLEAGGLHIPKNVRDADILTQYPVQSRYPSVVEEITRNEYREALKLAADVVFRRRRLSSRSLARRFAMPSKIISFSIPIILLVACTAQAGTIPAPAQQTSEVSEISEVSTSTLPTLTITETLAPTPTPEPTAKPEIGEFIPANDIEFVEGLPSYDLTLAPDADRKGIYWDIIISHLGDAISPSIPENQAILAKVLEKRPEYEGIGHGADYKVKQAFMQAFLEESGGKMIVTDIKWRKYEADFNQDIKFEVVHGNKLPINYEGAMRGDEFDKLARGGGFAVFTNEQGQLVYSVMVVNNTLEYIMQNKDSVFHMAGWTAGGIISNVFRMSVAHTALHSRGDSTVTVSDYRYYIKGSAPTEPDYVAKAYWFFIK